jgi:mannosyl-oligosaccharide alpha-1,2-mannosidase
MYDKYLAKAKEELFFKPMNPDNLDILLVGSVEIDQTDVKVKLVPEGQHLSCFVGGLVALGSKVFQRPDDLSVARKLVDGCVWAYSMTPTGIMPEVFSAIPPPGKGKKNKWDRSRWVDGVKEKYPIGSKDEAKDENARAEQVIKSMRLPQGVTKIVDSRYILRYDLSNLPSVAYKRRPEAIESVFILYRITGERRYQEVAWKMFQSIESATRTDMSYASIQDVTNPDAGKTDASESFWMGETLKYFFLIFSEPDVWSLDDWVL